MFTALRLRDTDGVSVSADRFRATFGRWSVDTPRSNVIGCAVTGPHRWWTAVGLRLSFADDGITFGTNHDAGLCIEFADRIPKVIGLRDHSSLWVSVADPQGLAAALG